MSKFGANIFVTGANRGIGLAFVQHLAKENEVEKIFACARNLENATELQDFEKSYPGKIFLIQLDVQNDLSIENAYNQVGKILNGDGLNLLINNAAVLETEGASYENANREVFLRTFDANVVGVVLVTKAFYPLVLKSAQKNQRALVVNISSDSGSIFRNNTRLSLSRMYKGGQGNTVVYLMSKAALNMYSHIFGCDEANNGIITVALHPGWVKTDMGGPFAELTVDESATACLKTIGELKIENSSSFIDWLGNPIEY